MIILLFIIFLSIFLILLYIYFQRKKIKLQEDLMHDIQRNLDIIQRQKEQLEQAKILSEQRTMEISNALINILGVRDANLNGHSKHVQNLTLLLYDYLPEETQRQIDRNTLSYAALFHDVGKMGIPESILNKPSKLDDNEWAIMKKHPQIATTILDTVSSFKNIEKLIMYHHERIDGKGYYGIPGDQIPYESKMIALADTYSAITMRRSYKDPKSNEEAMSILQKVKGTQLDAELVDIFCKIPLKEIMKCAPENLDVIRELTCNS